RGKGVRRVSVSYALEAPVWKATYRIILGEEGRPPTIQGWAVVDNTQDEDWEDVSLSLVAGLPVSFVHDLYTPRYLLRPVVAVPEPTGGVPREAELGMQTESVDWMLAEFTDAEVDLDLAAVPAAKPQAARMAIPRSAVSSAPAQVRERQLGDLFEYQIEHP